MLSVWTSPPSFCPANSDCALVVYYLVLCLRDSIAYLDYILCKNIYLGFRTHRPDNIHVPDVYLTATIDQHTGHVQQENASRNCAKFSATSFQPAIQPSFDCKDRAYASRASRGQKSNDTEKNDTDLIYRHRPTTCMCWTCAVNNRN